MTEEFTDVVARSRACEDMQVQRAVDPPETAPRDRRKTLQSTEFPKDGQTVVREKKREIIGCDEMMFTPCRAGGDGTPGRTWHGGEGDPCHQSRGLRS